MNLMNFGAAEAATAAYEARKAQIGGVLVELDPKTFLNLMAGLKAKGVLVIHGLTGVFSKEHVYLIPYQGAIFLTKSKTKLPITPDVEARKLRLPSL